MTPDAIENYLSIAHPGYTWVVSDILGIGTPMLDGVMLYHPYHAPTVERDLDAIAKSLLAMVSGKPAA